jgi:hypothetical protein
LPAVKAMSLPIVSNYYLHESKKRWL